MSTFVIKLSSHGWCCWWCLSALFEVYFFFFKSSPEDVLFIDERESEQDIDVSNTDRVPAVRTLTWDRTHGPGTCADQELNPKTFGAWYNTPTN